MAEVIGIDAAHWQGVLPVDTLAAAGIRFAIVKAVHGLGLNPDAQFTRSFRALRGVMPRSAYLWFTDANPIEQAEHFVRVVTAAGYDDADLPLAVDFEEPSTAYRGVELLDRLRACLARVRALIGRAPLLYTGKWYWDGYVALDAPDIVETYPLWHAQYPRAEVRDRRACGIAPPALPAPTLAGPWASRGVHEAIWQFDGDGGCVLPNGVDADFNRADEAVLTMLLDWRTADTDPAPPPEPGPTRRDTPSALAAVDAPIVEYPRDGRVQPLHEQLEGEHTVPTEEPEL